MTVHRRITEGLSSTKGCPASLVVRNLDMQTAVHAITFPLGGKKKEVYDI